MSHSIFNWFLVMPFANVGPLANLDAMVVADSSNSAVSTIDGVGLTRPQGSAFDLGSLELVFVPPAPLTTSLKTQVSIGPLLDATATVQGKLGAQAKIGAAMAAELGVNNEF